MTEELNLLREALRRVKYEAASLADAQVIALEALTQRPAAQEPCQHVLYETTDADRPTEICDRNGEVVLAMCKLCRKAEVELEDAQRATPEPVGDVRCEGCGYMTHHREHMGCVRAAKQHTRPAPDGWTEADADAARLAMELECLLLDTNDTAAVSRWWKSANDALDLHRARLAAAQAKGGAA